MALDADRVLKPARKLRKILKKFPKNPTPEQVHTLRTNARRLEAIFGALLPDGLDRSQKLLGLARVRKKAGRVRDMDVLTQFSAGVSAEGEQEGKVQLLKHLGSKRRRKAGRLHKTVEETLPTIRPRLKRTSADLEEILCVNGKQDCDPEIPRAHVTRFGAGAGIKIVRSAASDKSQPASLPAQSQRTPQRAQDGRKLWP
jgi:CHAD domain-containing protein